MANQISVKPEHGPDSIRLFPQRSVPMPGTKTLFHVHDRDHAMALVNPIPHGRIDRSRRKFFQIFCTPCTESPARRRPGRGEIHHPPLRSDRRERAEDGSGRGYIFRHGDFRGAFMPSYGNDLSPSEIWDVVNYVGMAWWRRGKANSVASNAAAERPDEMSVSVGASSVEESIDMSFASWSVLTVDFLVVLHLRPRRRDARCVAAPRQCQIGGRDSLYQVCFSVPSAGILPAADTTPERCAHLPWSVRPCRCRVGTLWVSRGARARRIRLVGVLYGLFVKYQPVSTLKPGQARLFATLPCSFPSRTCCSAHGGWDFEMTLTPGWSSAIYGMYHFVAPSAWCCRSWFSP